MTPNAAAQLLELSSEATPDQIEARFRDLRTKLEDKIAKAPTPGLKAKYRESLEQITEAFETLTLAADGSSLPVVQKSKVEGPGSKVESPVSPREFGASTVDARPSTPPRAKTGGGREFAVVALIAVLVLAAGGWFIMKVRAENAEKARIAAEAQAEADRLAEVARQEAEAEKARLAEERRLAEIEQQRLAEAAAAEARRLEALAASLRAKLAELNIVWEMNTREERDAERKLNDLRSEQRSLREPSPGVAAETAARVVAQERYYDWLSDFLGRNPVRLLQARVEELISARAYDQASPLLTELAAKLRDLEREIVQQRAALLDLDGELALTTDADVSWTLVDAFGKTRSGTGSAKVDGLAIGPGNLHLTKPLWPDRVQPFVITSRQPQNLSLNYQGSDVRLTSVPGGAEVRSTSGETLGVTPLALTGLPPGLLRFSLQLEGFYEKSLEFDPAKTASDLAPIELIAKPTGFTRPRPWLGPVQATVKRQIWFRQPPSKRVTLEGSMEYVYDLDLLEQDSNSRWNEAILRFGQSKFSGTILSRFPQTKSVLRLQRQSDDSWTGAFTVGGVSDSDWNHHWTTMADPGSSVFLIAEFDWWPAGEVPVGGTWTVEPQFMRTAFNAVDLDVPVMGRLIEIDHRQGRPVATIEFSCQHSSQPKGKYNHESVMTLRVDLWRGYALSKKVVVKTYRDGRLFNETADTMEITLR